MNDLRRMVEGVHIIRILNHNPQIQEMGTLIMKKNKIPHLKNHL